MLNMIKTKSFLAFCLLAVPIFAVAQQRAVYGPIESAPSARSQVTVLGQTFLITAATKFSTNGRQISASQATANFSAGQAISIVGLDTSKGSVAERIDLRNDPYIPGATPVYVLGRVTASSSDIAQIEVGSLRIDASSVAPETLALVKTGTVVEVLGIQTGPGHQLVGPVQLSIGGTGAQRQSIGGTGAQRLSIGGTGMQRQSIGGTGAQLQIIGGTGSQLQSIGGTGFQTLSIGGTGFY